jgi:predicted CoA-substrate-specific enzyme activase
MVKVIKIDDVLDSQLTGELNNFRSIGIDIGSRAAKALLLYNGDLYYKLVPSGVSSEETGRQLLNTITKEAGIDKLDIQYIVGTGYGRVAMDFGSIPFSGLTEISCHALGAHYLNANTRTIVDIGGQDSKAINIDPETGKVIEFIMNDKCAAGTGRFLEKVAMLLEITITELGDYALRSTENIDISSQCVVFAESEIVSLRALGKTKEDIAAGIHKASARRVMSLLKRTGFIPTVLFTGGVSNNSGMRKALEDVTHIKLGNTKLDTTFAGALGAAISAGRLANNSTAIN